MKTSHQWSIWIIWDPWHSVQCESKNPLRFSDIIFANGWEFLVQILDIAYPPQCLLIQAIQLTIFCWHTWYGSILSKMHRFRDTVTLLVENRWKTHHSLNWHVPWGDPLWIYWRVIDLPWQKVESWAIRWCTFHDPAFALLGIIGRVSNVTLCPQVSNISFMFINFRWSSLLYCGDSFAWLIHLRVC